MNSSRKKHFWMALITVAGTLCIVLPLGGLLLEGVFRVFFPQPLGISYRSEMSIPVHTPNYTLHRKEPEFEITTTFNSWGLRDREYSLEKPAGTERILVLGDSITAALEVDDSQVYTEILEASLNSPQSGTKYEVINAGVSGFGQGDQLKMLEYLGGRLDPDVVLVQMSPINDLSENLFCRWYEIRDGEVFTLADVDPGWAVRFEEFLGRHSHLVQFLRGRLHGYFGDKGDHFQKIAEHKRRYHDLLFGDAGDSEGFQEDWEVTFAYLDAIHRRVLKEGAHLCIVVRPLDPDVQGTRTSPYPRDLIRGYCHDRNIPYLDLTETFREKTEGDLYRLRFEGDSHWRPSGHRWAAEAILPFLQTSTKTGGISESESGQAMENWGQWRGPLSTGVAPMGDPPIRWSEEEGVRWKTQLPGLGHSTPVVWDDRVFLTAAYPVGEEMEPRYSDAPGSHDNLPVTHEQEFAVIALDLDRGDILWRRTVHREIPEDQGHHTGSLASQSPVTDGEVVIASFGSFGVFALDMDGNSIWERDLGQMESLHGHGEGGSPVLAGETVVLSWDHEGPSFIVALNKWTGEEVWRRDRDEVTSWSTPIVVEVAGRPQVVVNGTHRIRGYDLETGETIWECGGLSSNVVASPVAGDGRVFAGSSYEFRALLAISIEGAEGDLTDTDRVLWRKDRGTPYVPSPLLYEDSLYYLHHYQGVLSRANVETGANDGPFRLEGIRNIYASPVGAAGRIYITDRTGKTIVIEHDSNPGILAVNTLDDRFSASAAIVGNCLLLRGEEALYCLGGE